MTLLTENYKCIQLKKSVQILIQYLFVLIKGLQNHAMQDGFRN